MQRTDTNLAANMYYENAIRKVYGNGLFCAILTLCLASFSFILAYEFQSIVFMSFSPKFICSDARIANASNVTWISRSDYYKLNSGRKFTLPFSNDSDVDQCYAAVSDATEHVYAFVCANFTYDDSMMRRTIITDYNLVCDKRIWANWLVAATMIAIAVGHSLAIFTDQFSRRRVLIFYMVMEIIWSLVTPFSTNLVEVFIFRIMRMLSIPLCYYATGLLYEILPARKRTIYGNCYWIPFCMGYMSTAGLAYLTRDWKLFRTYGLLGLIGYIPLFFLLPESPRWLILNGKYEEYRKILATLAKWNGMSLPEEFFDEAVAGVRSVNMATLKEPVQRPETLVDIFRSTNVRCILLVFSAQLSAVSIGYYGLSTNADFASDNVFLNVFYMGLSEAPSSFLGWFLCHLFSRCCSFIFAAVFVIPSLLLAPILRPLSSIANTLIISIGKLMLTVEYNICLLHMTEFFPTTVRNMGLFFVMAFGCAISGLSAFINDLHFICPYLPGIVYATMNLIATLLTFLFLPNTKDCPLAQSISQAESLRRGAEKQWITSQDF
ncbi:Solute carrier family 22 member 5 [Taenia solium]|eukprot:TsM_000350800 transcript=TsM_000350800 gene=TsM_000350800